MLGVFRIVVGVLFMFHGTQKLFAFPPSDMPGAPYHLTSLLGFAGLLELVGGAMIAVGLFTRPVAFLLAGQMAVAYFRAHFPRSFLPISNGGELAVLFCFSYLYLMMAGAGAYSLDGMIARGRKQEEPPREAKRPIDRVA
jgi:putative oxidoreductase